MELRTTILGLALICLGCERVPVNQNETVRVLETLGYFATAPTDEPDVRGVTTASPATTEGVNLYSSRRRASALLIDTDGDVLHRWQDPHARGWRRSWMHIEPLQGGDLLAIIRDHELVKLDRDSNVLWRTPIRAHHDLAVRDDGSLLVLTRNRTKHSFRGVEVPVLADTITTVSADGKELARAELLPLFDRWVSTRRVQRISSAAERLKPSRLYCDGCTADILHTNSIALLHRDLPGVAPAGSVLISLRDISRIAILSADFTEVLWTWGRNELGHQHDATQLENGNILLFDNQPSRRRSRVIEVDPQTGEIAWSFTDENLFSHLRGGAQELPSGNILITESDRGHALEVTRDEEVVWEFWNPDVREGPTPERAVIYRMNRFDPALFEPR